MEGKGAAPSATSGGRIDAERLRLLYDLGCAFAAQARLDDLCEVVLAKCREALDAEAASILLHDRETDELYFPYVAEQHPGAAECLHHLRFPADHGIAGAVLKSGAALRIADTATDPRFYTGVDRRTGLHTRNLLCAPLRSHQGPIGVIQVLNHVGENGFTDDDLAFLDALAGSIAVAIDNARLYGQLTAQVAALERAVREHNELLALRRELDIASSIQQSIVPQKFPERGDVELWADMIPAQEVGGDFYDFFFIDEAHLGLVIGDVSGKGVPAALFMAVTRTLLRSTALAGAAPAECLSRVNELLIPENTAEMFVTVFYGILDLRSGSLDYSNGGHNAPYVVRPGEAPVVLARTGGTVLGVLDGVRYGQASATIADGEGLFLYSDGITEAMDAGGTLFGEARLERALAAAGARTAEQVVLDVVGAVQRHCDEAAQSDDITALMLKR